MSKSGLFAHFGSKEELQLGVLDTAVERFVNKVVAPALQAPRGIPRLQDLFDRWLNWERSPKLPGGCPFIPFPPREGRGSRGWEGDPIVLCGRVGESNRQLAVASILGSPSGAQDPY